MPSGLMAIILSRKLCPVRWYSHTTIQSEYSGSSGHSTAVARFPDHRRGFAKVMASSTPGRASTTACHRGFVPGFYNDDISLTSFAEGTLWQSDPLSGKGFMRLHILFCRLQGSPPGPCPSLLQIASKVRKQYGEPEDYG